MDDSVTLTYAFRTRFALKQPELDVVDATTEDSKNVVCPGCRQPVIWREANGRHFFEHIGQSCSQAIE